MARTNNLTNFLNDVATAIKQKTGDNTPIPASEFDTKIGEIETGGNYQSKTLDVRQNGNYNLLPDTGYDAISNVGISVSVSPILQNKTITENGTYTADQNYDGLDTIIVNVQGSEDLQEQLDNQDRIIAEMQEELRNKAGGGGKPNIFVQSTEPASKDGIWLQTNKTAEHYISDDNIFFGGTWSSASDTAPIPYAFYDSSAVAIGTDIYILGGSGGSTRNYKYNTLTNTYTQLTDIPYAFSYGSAVAIGTDIYLLGSSTKNYNYKYNTVTNTYTRLTNIPYSFYYGSAVAVGTDVYLLGGTSNTRAYKYNTLTDTYTQLTDIPYVFYNGSAVAVGTDIYILGSNYSSTKNYNYKYNTVTNTYTQLTNIPYAFSYGSAVAIGTDIYLLGSSANSNNNYKYNTVTNTYTRLTNIPYRFYEGSAVAVGTDVYLLGSFNSTNTRIYHLENKSYELDNSVIIAQGRTYDVGYNVKLFETEFESAYQPLYGFADAWFYTIQDGLIRDIPIYYGNGTEWIKIRGGAE